MPKFTFNDNENIVNNAYANEEEGLFSELSNELEEMFTVDYIASMPKRFGEFVGNTAIGVGYFGVQALKGAVTTPINIARFALDSDYREQRLDEDIEDVSQKGIASDSDYVDLGRQLLNGFGEQLGINAAIEGYDKGGGEQAFKDWAVAFTRNAKENPFDMAAMMIPLTRVTKWGMLKTGNPALKAVVNSLDDFAKARSTKATKYITELLDNPVGEETLRASLNMMQKNGLSYIDDMRNFNNKSIKLKNRKAMSTLLAPLDITLRAGLKAHETISSISHAVAGGVLGRVSQGMTPEAKIAMDWIKEQQHNKKLLVKDYGDALHAITETANPQSIIDNLEKSLAEKEVIYKQILGEERPTAYSEDFTKRDFDNLETNVLQLRSRIDEVKGHVADLQEAQKAFELTGDVQYLDRIKEIKARNVISANEYGFLYEQMRKQFNDKVAIQSIQKMIDNKQIQSVAEIEFIENQLFYESEMFDPVQFKEEVRLHKEKLAESLDETKVDIADRIRNEYDKLKENKARFEENKAEITEFYKNKKDDLVSRIKRVDSELQRTKGKRFERLSDAVKKQRDALTKERKYYDRQLKAVKKHFDVKNNVLKKTYYSIKEHTADTVKMFREAGKETLLQQREAFNIMKADLDSKSLDGMSKTLNEKLKLAEQERKPLNADKKKAGKDGITEELRVKLELANANIAEIKGEIANISAIKSLQELFSDLGYKGSIIDIIENIDIDDLNEIMFTTEKIVDGKTIKPSQRFNNALPDKKYSSNILQQLVEKKNFNKAKLKLQNSLVKVSERIAERTKLMDNVTTKANAYVDYLTETDMSDVRTKLWWAKHPEFFPNSQFNDLNFNGDDLLRYNSVPEEFRNPVPESEYTKRYKELDSIKAQRDKAIDDFGKNSEEVKRLNKKYSVTLKALSEVQGHQFQDIKGRFVKRIEDFTNSKLAEKMKEIGNAEITNLSESIIRKASGEGIQDRYRPPVVLDNVRGSYRNELNPDGTFKWDGDKYITGLQKKSGQDEYVVSFKGNEGQALFDKTYVKVTDEMYLNKDAFDQMFPINRETVIPTMFTVGANWMMDMMKVKMLSTTRSFLQNVNDELFKGMAENLINRTSGMWTGKLVDELKDVSAVKSAKDTFKRQLSNFDDTVKLFEELTPEERQGFLDDFVKTDRNIQDLSMKFSELTERVDSTMTKEQQFFDDILRIDKNDVTDKFTQHIDNIRLMREKIQRELDVEPNSTKKKAYVSMLKGMEAIQSNYIDNFYAFYGYPDNLGRIASKKNFVNSFLSEQADIAKADPNGNYITNLSDLKKSFSLFSEQTGTVKQLRRLADMARESTLYHMDNGDPVSYMVKLRNIAQRQENPLAVVMAKSLFAFTSYSSMQMNAYVNKLLGVYTGMDLWGRKLPLSERFANLAFLSTTNLASYQAYNPENKDGRPTWNAANLSYAGVGARYAETVQDRLMKGERPQKKDLLFAIGGVASEDLISLVTSNLLVSAANDVQSKGISGLVDNLLSATVPAPKVFTEELPSLLSGEKMDIADWTMAKLDKLKNNNPDSVLSDIIDVMQVNYKPKKVRRRVDSIDDILYPYNKTKIEKQQEIIRSSKRSGRSRGSRRGR